MAFACSGGSLRFSTVCLLLLLLGAEVQCSELKFRLEKRRDGTMWLVHKATNGCLEVFGYDQDPSPKTIYKPSREKLGDYILIQELSGKLIGSARIQGKSASLEFEPDADLMTLWEWGALDINFHITNRRPVIINVHDV